MLFLCVLAHMGPVARCMLVHVQPDTGLPFPGPVNAASLQAVALGTPCRVQTQDPATGPGRMQHEEGLAGCRHTILLPG